MMADEAVALALHALVIEWTGGQRSSGPVDRPKARPAIAYLKLLPPPAVEAVVAERVPQSTRPSAIKPARWTGLPQPVA